MWCDRRVMIGTLHWFEFHFFLFQFCRTFGILHFHTTNRKVNALITCTHIFSERRQKIFHKEKWNYKKIILKAVHVRNVYDDSEINHCQYIILCVNRHVVRLKVWWKFQLWIKEFFITFRFIKTSSIFVTLSFLNKLLSRSIPIDRSARKNARKP